ncbi:MAG: hypothetical protein E7588_03455 [Ruminococcaceae bacterium]|nr:hypothetical protein [Oscillospiraceae bacterium]
MKRNLVILAMVAMLMLLTVSGAMALSIADLETTTVDVTSSVTFEKSTSKGNPYEYRLGCASLTHYTEQEAKAAGVPEGFTGDVWKATPNGSGASPVIDMSAAKILIEQVKSITFRIYSETAAGSSQFRINDATDVDQWVTMQNYPSTSYDQWVEFTLDSSTFEAASDSFAMLSTNEYLGRFEVGTRTNNKTGAVYFDSVVVELYPEQYDTNVNFTVDGTKGENDTDDNFYVGGTITKLGLNKAITEGLPEGFSKSVWKVAPSSTGLGSVGAMIEFDEQIKISEIEYFIFRVYAPEDASTDWGPNLRIARTTKGEWLWGVSTGQSGFDMFPDTWTKGWCDVKVKSTDMNMNSLDINGDGYLDRFNLISRRNDTSDPYYIDTISVKYTRGVDESTLDYTKMPKLAPQTEVQDNPPYKPSMAIYKDNPPSSVSGFEDYVWQFKGTADTGTTATIDFSGMQIPANRVDSIVLRMYIPSPSSQIRLTATGTTTRIMYNSTTKFYTLNTETELDQWFDFRITNDMLSTNYKFINLADENGYLTGLDLSVFNSSATTRYFLIDSVKVELLETDEFPCDVINTLSGNKPHYGGTAVKYTSANIPDELKNTSYNGTVLKISSTGSSGATINLDFLRSQIPAKDIESVTIRMWAPAENPNGANSSTEYPQVRFSQYNVTSWLNYGNLNAFDLQKLDKMNQWVDIELTEEFLASLSHSFTELKDANGYFKGLTLTVRSNSNCYFYIDSISVKLKQDAAPVEIDGDMLGAQIRTTEPQGLRFGTSVNFTDGIALEQIQYTENAGDIFYAGTIIIPVSELADDVTPSNFTHANVPAESFADVRAENIYTSTETSATYTAVVWDIPEGDKPQELVARSYICYNGTYYYFAPVVRSVAQVENAMGGEWNNN